MKLRLAMTVGLLAGMLVQGQAVNNTSHAPSAHPENNYALDEIQGHVEAVDVQGRRFSVRDAQDREHQVRIDPATRILDHNNRIQKLSWLKQNDPVVVYLNREDGAARQVDLQPTLSDTILGQ
jgi:hypothetical protein